MSTRWVGGLGLALFLAWPLACTSFGGTQPPLDQPDGSTPPDASGTEPVTGEPDRGITVDLGGTTPAFVIQGKSLDIPVTLTRHAASEGPVRVVVGGLPSKVTADQLVIPANALTGTLTLHAAPDAVQGSTDTQLTATSVNDGANAVATPTVFVRGPGGSLDLTFAGNGFVANMFPGDESEATDARVLSDGSMLVGGRRNVNSVISRYKADGTLDSAFGTAGTVTLGATDAGALIDVYEGTTPAQGFIYALEVGGTSSPKLYRVKLDGTLDSSFGTMGVAPVVDGLSGTPTGSRVFALPTGNALVAVYHGSSPPALSRWLPTGQLDMTYGVSGVCALGGLGDAFLKAGGSVMTAYVNNGVGYAQGCNAAGLPDGTVAPDPSFKFNMGFTHSAVENDGSFLFLNPQDQISPTLIQHYSRNYVIDAGFTMTFTSPPTNSGAATFMLIHPDGGLLLASGFVIARQTLPGGDNHDFGTNGVATYQVAGGVLDQVVIHPDGRILALGKSGFFGAMLRIWP